MEDDPIYRKARSLGYHWSQTEAGRKKIDQIMEINRQRFVILDGMQEGIDLAEWERKKSPKTKTMEDEKVDPNYTKGFNLGYWLNKNQDGESHYTDLMSMQKSEKFKETSVYKGLVAGREQAFKERAAEKTDDKERFALKLDEFKEEGNVITEPDGRQSGGENAKVSRSDDPEPPKTPDKKRQTGLSDEQINELNEWEAGEQDRAARKEYKEGTRRINENTFENLQAHRIEEHAKKEAEAKKKADEEKERNFIDRFLNKGKNREKDRGRD